MHARSLMLASLVVSLVVGAWFAGRSSRPVAAAAPDDHGGADHGHDHGGHDAGGPSSGGSSRTVRLTAQARGNLGIVSKPARLQNYWRSVDIPGRITDLPG